MYRGASAADVAADVASASRPPAWTPVGREWHAALGARRDTRPSAPVALAYTLVGGGRNIVDRELFVTRAVVRLATAAGFTRVAHVLDDPMRYGVEPDTQKRGGGTFTSWLVLEP